jgi:histidyl-tRNA synthetase
VRFGSVGGGGRYDGLVSRFPRRAGAGDRLLDRRVAPAGGADPARQARQQARPGPVVVTVFDRDRVADYQKMVATLRNAGIRAELYLGNPKNNVGQQLKYADKRNSPCAIIQGGDEKVEKRSPDQGLDPGRRLTAIKDRDEYLKKQAEAQFAVPVDKLGRGCASGSDRHGIAWTDPGLVLDSAARAELISASFVVRRSISPGWNNFVRRDLAPVQ